MPFRLTGSVNGRPISFLFEAGTFRIGAAAECDLRLKDPTISRHHAELRVAGEAEDPDVAVEIVDLASRNGTFVDGQRIANEQVRPPAEIAFGRVSLRLEEVAAEDCETGVEIAPRPTPRPARRPATGALAATTLGTRALDVFACEELPELLRILGEGADAGAMARTAGAALVRCLPLLGLEITCEPAGEEPGVLFLSEAGGGAGEVSGTATVGWQLEAIAVRAIFPSAAAGEIYRPLLESAARLVAIASDESRASPRVASGDDPRHGAGGERRSRPSLPEPASLDPEMRRIYADAASVAAGDVGVLILGESGTGKEILARYLHAASSRAGGAFVALNCAALPRDLLEAELFGVERGVATGVDARPGKFELADGGTLFLDEIGDMELPTQARILRVLQAREVHRLGGAAPRPARVRVVAATHRDLAALRAEGSFRDDLYYRIAAWEVELPPLRRRRADVPSLAAWFLSRAAARRRITLRGISRGALDRLVAYDWPGNVRQLENEMERAALFLAEGDLLGSSRLSPEVQAGPRIGDHGTLAARLLEVERVEIAKALAAASGDVVEAAERLGLGRSTLYRRIQDLGLGAAEERKKAP